MSEYFTPIESHEYDDIINTPYTGVRNHPHMPISKRAAQFAPFAALSGYSELVHETERYTDELINLDELERESIDRKLQYITKTGTECTVKYFIPDKTKPGGEYKSITGCVSYCNSYSKYITIDNITIDILSIVDIDCNGFDETS